MYRTAKIKASLNNNLNKGDQNIRTMGTIKFEAPPDIQQALAEQHPMYDAETYQLMEQSTTSTTREFETTLQTALNNVYGTATGKEIYEQALTNRRLSGGDIYLYIDPTQSQFNRQSRTYVTPEGHTAIAINPCDAHRLLLAEDGNEYQTGLARLIGHELTHIANGDIYKRFRSHDKAERQAIESENQMAKEANPNAPQRITDNYEGSSRLDNETLGTCKPTDFGTGF